MNSATSQAEAYREAEMVISMSKVLLPFLKLRQNPDYSHYLRALDNNTMQINRKRFTSISNEIKDSNMVHTSIA